jgi:hypothetical protein
VTVPSIFGQRKFRTTMVKLFLLWTWFSLFIIGDWYIVETCMHEEWQLLSVLPISWLTCCDSSLAVIVQ